MADFLLDTATRHQHFLERLKTGNANKFEKFLRMADKRVRELLTDAGTIENRRKLATLQREITDALQAVYARWDDELTSDLVEIMSNEANFELRTIEKLLGGEVDMIAPDVASMQREAFSRPFQGKTLRKLLADFADEEALRVAGVVRQGFFDGRSVTDIVRDIRGTKGAQFTDGALRQTDIRARRIARTAVQHFASVARHEVYAENDDIITEYEWVAVLDSRTSNICMTLDGQVWKVGAGPLPPAHPNCRSTTLPIIEGEGPPVVTDSTGKRRVRGQQTYGKWLRKQPKAFQIEALGPTKAQLFRKGELAVERFTDRTNAPLTLDELRRLNPVAWAKAGLDE